MRIFALGDPHLSFDDQGNIYKPMDIFGDQWENHHLKIEKNWESFVRADDVVLIPGDLSWALKLEEALPDLQYLGRLPGIKVIIKGNHDLWWQSITKVRNSLPVGMHAIQNDHILLKGNIAVCGTRGWTCPGDNSFQETEDRKIYERELIRLRMSLESIKDEVKDIIVMLHYPPTNGKHELSGFIELLRHYQVKKCVYAHLHSTAIKGALPNRKWDINFCLVSADAVDFTPKLISAAE
ncbi:MAG: metallophosphoesterase [Peptococcaceae bacterium]